MDADDCWVPYLSKLDGKKLWRKRRKREKKLMKQVLEAPARWGLITNEHLQLSAVGVKAKWLDQRFISSLSTEVC